MTRTKNLRRTETGDYSLTVFGRHFTIHREGRRWHGISNDTPYIASGTTLREVVANLESGDWQAGKLPGKVVSHTGVYLADVQDYWERLNVRFWYEANPDIINWILDQNEHELVGIPAVHLWHVLTSEGDILALYIAPSLNKFFPDQQLVWRIK